MGLHQFDPGLDADALGQFAGKLQQEFPLLGHLVEKEALPHLDLDLQVIQVAFPADDQLKGGLVPLEAGQNLQ